MFEWLKRSWREHEWRKAFHRVHPGLSEHRGEPERIRLILGPGRSGTSWLSSVLSRSSTPLRFVSEPLHPFRPKLPYSSRYDHTALPYCHSIEEDSPLVRVYMALTSRDDSLSGVLPEDTLRRDDKDFSLCLIKEVHSLLATEALLKMLRCPVIILTRDPIYVVDSLMSFRGLNAPIWRNEANYVRTKLFLSRFFGGESEMIEEAYRKNDRELSKRTRLITEKVLTVAVMNKMLHVLSNDMHIAHHIEYEELCKKPSETVSRAAQILSLEVSGEMVAYLGKTQRKRADDVGPYSVFRETSKQTVRPLRFVTTEEAEAARRSLRELGLAEHSLGAPAHVRHVRTNDGLVREKELQCRSL